MHLSYFSKHVVRTLLLVVISAAFTACGDRGGNSDDGGTTGTRPTAAAGADQTVAAGDLVILNGRNSSDPQDLPLTYSWEQLEGPRVTLSAADTVRATFTAPSFATNTTLTFALTVDNGTANAIDTVVITVNDDTNTLTPTANAGRNQTVIAGAAVRLDGSASSGGGGGALAYSWAQISGDSVVLVNEDQSIATFTAPAVSEVTQLRFTLTVSSGGLADSDNVLVTVNPVPDTTPPTILTRSPTPGATGVSRSTTVTVGFDEAMLEASIDGTTFRLRQGTSDTAGSFDYDASVNILTFTPSGNLAGNRDYTVLIDGITDLAGNPVAPTQWTFTTSANAGPNVVVTDDDQFVTRGLPADLDASGSTDDLTPEDQLQFEWTQTAGTAVVLLNPAAANPSFATDALDIETLVFSVTVTDGDGISTLVENVYVTVLEDAANALFVASTGADVNDGTRDEPFRTVSRALSAANAAPSPRPDIYITTGSYTAPLTLNISSGVSIYGSFDASFHRIVDADVVPDTVINGARTAMTASTITSPTYLDLVDIRAAASTTSGLNSVGLAVIDSNFASPRFLISRTNISARNGASGTDGVNGADGSDGVDGSAGESGTVTGSGAPAAVSTCGLGGSGAGGDGRVGDRDGRDGSASADGVPGGAGGAASVDDPVVRAGESGGSIATLLPAGDAGAAGLAAGSIVGNTWQPSLGASGNAGAGGASGGGGGGGAGFDISRGGGGGSGGTGGCAGVGGTGGRGGSGSFAVVLSNSSVTIRDSVLTTGDGGRGGNGGAGGLGGGGGTGGVGGAGEGEAGSGGNGGDGQAGSAGGPGGVGAGGPSIGILALSGSPLPGITSIDFDLGSPGEPGVPAIGGAAGQQGLSGLTLELEGP